MNKALKLVLLTVLLISVVGCDEVDQAAISNDSIEKGNQTETIETNENNKETKTITVAKPKEIIKTTTKTKLTQETPKEEPQEESEEESKELPLTQTKTQKEPEEETKKQSLETPQPKAEDDVYHYVGFLNIYGGTLYRDNVKHGTIPTYSGPTPTYSDYDYDYEFVGWSNQKGGEPVEIVPITKTTFYYAAYNKTPKAIPPELEGCPRTDELLYVIAAHDEDRTQYVEGYGDFAYVTHVLRLEKYEYNGHGYSYNGSTQTEGNEIDISMYIGKEGQYVHSDGSICPNPESHNIH